MREAREAPMTRTRPRLFYGWWVVVTSALALFLGPIPIVVFSFGVFLKPLIKEFHSGRGAVSLAFTLHNAIIAFCLPFAGRLVDRFGARRVIVPSTFTVGLIMLSTYFCSGRIWVLYLFYVALGVAGCGAAPVSYCDVISHWFDRYRGLALGFMMFGLGAGALIMPSAARYLIARFGWRLAVGFFRAAILVITAPAVTRFLKERPEPLGLLPDGIPHVATASTRPDDDPGTSWSEAWRAPTFWLLFCAFVLSAGAGAGTITYSAPTPLTVQNSVPSCTASQSAPPRPPTASTVPSTPAPATSSLRPSPPAALNP
jgi:MFS family permease